MLNNVNKANYTVPKTRAEFNAFWERLTLEAVNFHNSEQKPRKQKRKMEVVKRILEEERRELKKFKSIQVEKHLDAKIDLGYLLCSDPNELDEVRLK